jgi:hypothetical protein
MNDCLCACHDPNNPLKSIYPAPCCGGMLTTEQVIEKASQLSEPTRDARNEPPNYSKR